MFNLKSVFQPFAAAILVALLAATSFGQTFYGDAVIARGATDGATGLLGIDGVIGQNGVVTDWQYWANRTGNNLTPLILQNDGGGSFTISGIGQTHVAPGLGFNGPLPFNLTAGSDAVVAGVHHVGFWDGLQLGGPVNNGTIAYDGTGGTGWANGGSIGSVAVGNNYNFSALNRAYSIQFGVVVPEPSGFGLGALAMGSLALFSFGGLGRRIGRRRR